MALASLSRSFLSRISSSAPSGDVATLPTMNSVSGPVSSASSPSTCVVVGDNYRDSVRNGGESSLLSGSFSPIRNMELYPPKSKVIEDGCIYEETPFNLLCGENVEYMGRLAEDKDLIYLTNYRLLVMQENGFYSVPLSIIDTIEVQSTKEGLTFLCKDCRVFRLVFTTPFKARSFLSIIQIRLQPFHIDYKNTFAFIHHAYRKDIKLGLEGNNKSMPQNDLSLISLRDSEVHRHGVTMEYHRIGFGSAGSQNPSNDRLWRISQCNSKYEICSSYPKLLIVPQSVKDEDIVQASKFRMSGRFPVVVWRHPQNGCIIARSSQPQVGVLSWRSSEDEKLLRAISEACSSRSVETRPRTARDISFLEESDEDIDGCGPKLIVMDLRSYTATLGNRAKGGGSECTDYYPNCIVQFKGLPNIHSVRKSFQQLRSLLASDDQISFLSNLEACQWLSYLSQLMSVSCEVISVVHDSAFPILIHCSDGWDRTAQVVALAELMLDPYYRTIKGFQVLVEREWLQFGHKFGDRCGHTTDDANQRCPIFMQWLDCVHQLIKQFPCDFQFNEQFLVKLGRHTYSCLFGTFLGNSMKEREDWRVREDTTSIWALLHSENGDFVNLLFEPVTKSEHKVLKPVTSISSIQLWRAMYCMSSLTSYLTCSQSTKGLLDQSDGDIFSVQVSSPSKERTQIDTDKESDDHDLVPNKIAPDDDNLSLDVEEKSPDVDDLSSTDKDINVEGGGLLSNSIEKCTEELITTKVHHDCVPNLEEHVSTLDTHENLHVLIKSGSILIPTDPEMNVTANTSELPGNHNIPALQSDPSSKSPFCSIEMLPVYKHSLASRGVSRDVSDSKFSTLNMETNNICRIQTGVDGLPICEDRVHQRLKTLEAIHLKEITELTKKLSQIKEKVAEIHSTSTNLSQVQIAVDELDKALMDQQESPSSITSWDYVEGDSGGVKWIPDHAVTHCVGCGGEFWAARRKHHCRSCGNVYCGLCSDYFCQVPHEQLYDDVRVCEKCFYKLDGHLRQKPAQSKGLT